MILRMISFEMGVYTGEIWALKIGEKDPEWKWLEFAHRWGSKQMDRRAAGYQQTGRTFDVMLMKTLLSATS